MLEVRIHHAHATSTRGAQPFDDRPGKPVVPLLGCAVDEPDRNRRRTSGLANNLGRFVTRVVDEDDLIIRGEDTLESADELENVSGLVLGRDNDRQFRYGVGRFDDWP